ncbi:hypothetical protein BV133_1964 [Blastochloris viridis]|uniref:Uncharacterized protein n=1 Tax=Blastochloris viridis TaxID=1079 RepID=A0A182D3L7_BLAVI|nr:hypothetical protein BV133_1964 [Blastochloris viridis]
MDLPDRPNRNQRWPRRRYGDAANGTQDGENGIISRVAAVGPAV